MSIGREGRMTSARDGASEVIAVVGASRSHEAEIREAAAGGEVVALPELSGEACLAAGYEPAQVTAVLGASPSDDLSGLPALRWVHSAAAGVDGWLGGAGLPERIMLTSAAGNGAIPLAEHALMLMLMLSRDAPRWMRAQTEHRWDRYSHGELAGQSLGIIGYGNSGRDLATKALACHMRVSALRRRVGERADRPVRILTGRDGLEELLHTSDVVVVTAPYTDATAGLLGAEEIAIMPEGAHLVVVSRGRIVEEDALIAALRSGHLAGAGLDAHSVEPLPADSPLWDLPGAIVTPHNGATSAATAERGLQIMLENVRRWCGGAELLNVVDRVNGY